MGTPLTDVTATEAANPLLEASPGLMVWTLITFFFVLWILKRKVFGPVSDVIEKRRTRIAEDLDQAEQGRRDAERLVEEYKARLEEARREADELRERARKDGERQASEILGAAQEQRERVLQDAQERIAAQARQAAAGVRDDVVSLAMLAAERVTRRTLSDDEHRRLIEEALSEADLSKLNGSAN
jgi:F-type H+-transporting ATPase subunit b